MEKNEKLYFVHEILQPVDETGKLSDTVSVALMNVPRSINEATTEFDYSGPVIETNIQQIEGILEGSFIRYKNGNELQNANDDPVAMAFIQANDVLRRKMIEHYSDPLPQGGKNIKKVRSYHINVGHGNFSVITFWQDGELQVWAIDASEKEPSFISKKNDSKEYRSNWQECFEKIKHIYGVDQFSISKLLLTHMHYDHFSAISQLVKENYFANGAEIWINLYYDCSNPAYTYTALPALQKIPNVRFVEPRFSVTQAGAIIQVLAPEERIYYKIMPPQTNMVNIVKETKANNASVIYKITLIDKSIVFPGDLQTEGWRRVSHCIPYMSNCNYYCISHHGSMNGHRRESCSISRPIINVSDCLLPQTICILMGRHMAYNGIYSQTVINDFDHCALHKSECTPTNQRVTYLVIDWENDDLIYYVDQIPVFRCSRRHCRIWIDCNELFVLF